MKSLANQWKIVKLLLLLQLSCGQPGKLGEEKVVVSPKLVGTIAGSTGEQGDMAGWSLALLDKDSRVGRLAEVDVIGSYTLRDIPQDGSYTMLLISPNFVVQAILSHPSSTDGLIHQFFNVGSGSKLPGLVHRGKIITFSDASSIKFDQDVASAANGDGVPDGMALHLDQFDPGVIKDQKGILNLLAKKQVKPSRMDTDGDQIDNCFDYDIDGDGSPNSLDIDNDGDAILDIFDEDSDGDLRSDSVFCNSDLHFSVGLEWIGVNFKMAPGEDGLTQKSLTFVAKRDPSFGGVLAIQVKGAVSFLNGAQVETVDAEGDTVLSEWDRLLFDDGFSEDGASGDNVFARKVVLDADLPGSNHIVFFELVYGNQKKPKRLVYPFVFPPISPSEITPNYEPITRTVGLQGNPFGDHQSFLWTVSVYSVAEDSTVKVFSSTPQTGLQRTFTLPDNIFEDGLTYQYKLTAQVLDRIPGYSPYTIESALTSLSASEE